MDRGEIQPMNSTTSRSSAMQTVTLTDGHKNLELLAGSWSGEDTCHPSPWNPELHQALGRSTCRLGLSGFAVIGDYEQVKDGQIVFTGHGVYTYDSRDDSYVCHWFDSMGLHPMEFRGKLVDGVLTLTTEDEQFGFGKLVYQLRSVNQGRYEFEMYDSKDGENWELRLEGKYRRDD